MRGEYESRLETLAPNPATPPGSPSPALLSRQYDDLRVALLAIKRDAVIRLRDDQQIDDTVLRKIQAILDAEELAAPRQRSPATTETPGQLDGRRTGAPSRAPAESARSDDQRRTR